MMDHSLSLADAAFEVKARISRSSSRIVLALLILSLWAPAARAQDAAPKSPIRIACVGDSITEGTANAEHRLNSWPRILGRLLETRAPGQYECGNFGRSGATLLRQGPKPYWDEDVFKQSTDYEPQIVIINLGTNDAVPANWLQHKDEFEQDYRDLIEVYRGLESKPQIWLSNLTAVHGAWARREDWHPAREEIERSIAALAEEYGLSVIDFKTVTSDFPERFPDGLHPNTAGNEEMARAAFEALLGEEAPRDVSLRFVNVPGVAQGLVLGGRAVDVRLGSWTQSEEYVEGTGARKVLLARVELAAGDFHVRARLRMLGQKNSAAAFLLGENTFGFEGARGTVFRNGPQMGGLRLLHPSETLWERESWIEFEAIRNRGMVWFLVNGLIVDMAHIPGPIGRLGFDPTRSRMQVAEWSVVGEVSATRREELDTRSLGTPWVDIAHRVEIQTQIVGNAAIADFGIGLSLPNELPAILFGSHHIGAYLPDGRVLITFRDGLPGSPTFGDLVAWVGSEEDIANAREGDFTARLLDAQGSGAETSPMSLQILKDGTVWSVNLCRVAGEKDASLISLRFGFSDLEELLPTRGFDVPIVDMDADEGRHVIVDREPGQYLGHVTTELLDDGKTILAVYPKGHGKGPIVYKRSTDGGRTWSERLPTPDNWSTSREVPTLHRVIDPKTGKKRLIMWSGLRPARLAVSEDEGGSWSELKAVGEWGGIVVMGFVERLADGSYLAMFHDDGRFFEEDSKRTNPPTFTLYQTLSHDGGLTWSYPEAVWSGTDVHLCEPGCIRSPDGKTLAVVLRENSRTRNSYVIFSEDEAQTWSAPRELPASLTGDRHTLVYAPDGRLFICFRDTAHDSPTQGDWVGWVGTWEDLRDGREGQYRVRFKDNKHRWDTTYPGVEVLPDGTFVVTTYGHWEAGEEPYILSVRMTLEELDARAAKLKKQ